MEKRSVRVFVAGVVVVFSWRLCPQDEGTKPGRLYFERDEIYAQMSELEKTFSRLEFVPEFLVYSVSTTGKEPKTPPPKPVDAKPGASWQLYRASMTVYVGGKLTEKAIETGGYAYKSWTTDPGKPVDVEGWKWEIEIKNPAYTIVARERNRKSQIEYDKIEDQLKTLRNRAQQVSNSFSTSVSRAKDRANKGHIQGIEPLIEACDHEGMVSQIIQLDRIGEDPGTLFARIAESNVIGWPDLLAWLCLDPQFSGRIRVSALQILLERPEESSLVLAKVLTKSVGYISLEKDGMELRVPLLLEASRRASRKDFVVKLASRLISDEEHLDQDVILRRARESKQTGSEQLEKELRHERISVAMSLLLATGGIEGRKLLRLALKAREFDDTMYHDLLATIEREKTHEAGDIAFELLSVVENARKRNVLEAIATLPLDKKFVDQLTKMLGDKELADESGLVLRAMVNCGPAALQSLDKKIRELATLRAPRPLVFSQILECIGQIGTKEATLILKRLLPLTEEFEHIIRALGATQEAEAATLIARELERAISNKARSGDVIICARALAENGTGIARKGLEEILSNALVCDIAIDGLKKMNDPSSIPAVAKAMKEGKGLADLQIKNLGELQGYLESWKSFKRPLTAMDLVENANAAIELSKKMFGNETVLIGLEAKGLQGDGKVDVMQKFSGAYLKYFFRIPQEKNGTPFAEVMVASSRVVVTKESESPYDKPLISKLLNIHEVLKAANTSGVDLLDGKARIVYSPEKGANPPSWHLDHPKIFLLTGNDKMVIDAVDGGTVTPMEEIQGNLKNARLKDILKHANSIAKGWRRDACIVGIIGSKVKSDGTVNLSQDNSSKDYGGKFAFRVFSPQVLLLTNSISASRRCIVFQDGRAELRSDVISFDLPTVAVPDDIIDFDRLWKSCRGVSLESPADNIEFKHEDSVFPSHWVFEGTFLDGNTHATLFVNAKNGNMIEK